MDVRLATVKDAQMLLEWRNDTLTRAMSTNTDVVEWDGHIQWLSKRLTRTKPHLYVAEVEGIPVGTIRIDDDVVSYTIAPVHRGKGYATAMLRWAHSKFGPLRAEIKRENVASVKAAEGAGHKIEILA